MSKILWKFSEPLQYENVLDDFEIEYAFRISDEFKQFITECNGGVPNKNIFDVPQVGKVLANLLSFNKDDDENVYLVLGNFIKNEKLYALPFATDGFGNYICLKGQEIAFWNHETDSMDKIADSLEAFLNMLH